jgi:hypothetical protein
MTLGEMGWVAAGEDPLYLREQAREFSTGFNIPFKNCMMRVFYKLQKSLQEKEH